MIDWSLIKWRDRLFFFSSKLFRAWWASRKGINWPSEGINNKLGRWCRILGEVVKHAVHNIVIHDRSVTIDWVQFQSTLRPVDRVSNPVSSRSILSFFLSILSFVSIFLSSSWQKERRTRWSRRSDYTIEEQLRWHSPNSDFDTKFVEATQVFRLFRYRAISTAESTHLRDFRRRECQPLFVPLRSFAVSCSCSPWCLNAKTKIYIF